MLLPARQKSLQVVPHLPLYHKPVARVGSVHTPFAAMETNRIFSAEQIVVHPDLPIILKDYSKALIRANPKNIDAFSAEYFRQKAGIEGDPVPGSAEKNDEA